MGKNGSERSLQVTFAQSNHAVALAGVSCREWSQESIQRPSGGHCSEANARRLDAIRYGTGGLAAGERHAAWWWPARDGLSRKYGR
jgi:hypothetical protein